MFRSILAAALIAAAPVWAEEGHDHDDHGDHGEQHVFELSGLEVLHPWAPATHEAEVFVFMELTNEGDAPIEIIGAEADIAAKAELVAFVIRGGEQTTIALPPVPVAPGRELELAPDLMAIHLTGLTDELHKGDHLDLHLVTSVGEIEIEVAVEAEGAHQHSHAGHAH